MKAGGMNAVPTTRKGQVRHFLSWWAVIVLMLLSLVATFCFGAGLLGYVAWIAYDPAQSFQSPWHWVAAVPFGLLAAVGSAWLFGYGVIILRGVIRASRDLAERMQARNESASES